MNGVILLGFAIALASIWGAAYLLRIWHEDATDMKRHGEAVTFLRTWPFSRVLAYVAIACMLASNFLLVPTALRLAGRPDLQVALTPFTLTSLIVLDVAFVVIALYLRVVRSRA